jgi:hypothetical protein
MIGFTIISGNYFKVANHLLELAHTGRGDLPSHYFVFPAAAMFVAAFEAYLQEHLALLRRRVADSEEPDRDATLQHLDTLKAQGRQFGEFKDWVKEIYKIFDTAGKGLDTTSDEYHNLLALKELRNSIIHYNPSFVEHIDWPMRLEQALHKAKVEIMNAGWVTNFSQVAVGVWAHDSVKAAVQLFSRLSNAEDPFAVSLERDGIPPWE